jgi:hypothetical protein
MKWNFLRRYGEKLATVPKNSSLYIACLHTIVEYSAFWDEVKIIYTKSVPILSFNTLHRLIIALFDWGRKWPPLEMVIYTSNFTAQTTMYVDFYNCLVF